MIFQQHARVLRLIPESLVQPFFHSSPFFGQRKLNTDEPTEQKEHIKFDTFLSQDLLCICSILPYKLCYTCRIRCWLRSGKEIKRNRVQRLPATSSQCLLRRIQHNLPIHSIVFLNTFPETKSKKSSGGKKPFSRNLLFSRKCE